jgi:hypothetical protein
MYKAWTSTEMRERLGLSQDYSLSGFISYGAWDDVGVDLPFVFQY